MRIERLGRTELRYIRNDGTAYSILGPFDELDRREREFYEIQNDALAAGQPTVNLATVPGSQSYQPQPPMLLADIPAYQVSDNAPLRVPVLNFVGPEVLIYPEQPAVPFTVPAIPMLNNLPEAPLPVPVMNFDNPLNRRPGVVQTVNASNHQSLKDNAAGAVLSDDSQPLPRPGW